MDYRDKITIELDFWKRDLLKKPSLFDQAASSVQKKINGYIPEKIHRTITAAIKTMVKTVLYGSSYTTSSVPPEKMSLIHREALIRKKVEVYCKTGATEGGITGAGGVLLGMVDFPLLIGIKLKLLFEIAALYGFDVRSFHERLYILYIFQLTFSSKEGSASIYKKIEDWDRQLALLPDNTDNFDWQTFQQEYRDYIDLAKMAQMLPVVGGAVGAVVNYRLIRKLGRTAMMTYRMRLLRAEDS